MNKRGSIEISIIWHRLARTLVWIPGILIIMLILSIAAFQLPQIQTNLINEVTELISAKTSFNITVDRAKLTWYDRIRLDNLRVFKKDNDSTLIFVEQITLDVNLVHFILSKEIKGRQLVLKSPELHIIKEEDSLSINLTQFLNELKGVFKKDDKKKKTTLDVSNIKIIGGSFSYNDLTVAPVTDRKDVNHLTYQNINAGISQLDFYKDSLSLHIDSLSARDPVFAFDIHSLTTRLEFSKKHLTFSDLLLQVGSSTIRDSVSFIYDTPTAFKYFVDSIQLFADLNQSIVHSKDIHLFNPAIEELEDTFVLSGVYSGKVGNLRLTDAQINVGESSHLNGSGTVIGLPSIKETFFDLTLINSYINPLDFKNYLPAPVFDKMNKLGETQLAGTFTGYFNDFVTRARIFSKLGYANGQLKLKISPDYRAHYQGQIELSEFALSEFIDLPDNSIESISLKGNIRGSGLEPDNAVFDLDAAISQLQYNDYTYKNIKTDAHFQKNIFTGNVQIDDPNLKLQGHLDIDLTKTRNKFDIEARLDTINLEPLNLSAQPFSFSSSINIDMAGSQLQDMRGFLNLTSFKMAFADKNMAVDSIKLISTTFNGLRVMQLDTDGLSAKLLGEYTNENLLKAVKSLFLDFSYQLKNDHEELDAYYANKSTLSTQPVEAELLIVAKDLNKFITPFFPKLSISKSISIEGKFRQDSTVHLSLYSKFDSSQWANSKFIGNEVDVSISKNFFTKEIIASAYASSSSQTIGNMETNGLQHEIIWYDDLVQYYGSINQPLTNTRLEVLSSALFRTDTTEIRFEPSNMHVFDERWFWNTNNLILFSNGVFTFKEFGLQSGNQSIDISGQYTQEETINLKVSNLNIGLLNTISKINFQGIMDGDFKIINRGDYHQIDARYISRDIVIDGYRVGNLFSTSTWNHEERHMDIKSYLTRDGQEKMNIDGYFDPYKKNGNSLNFTADFEDMQLKTIDPFIQQFSDIRGLLRGKFEITGSIPSPTISGSGHIENGSVSIDYLNTTYGISGDIVFNKNSLYTRQFNLMDKDQNKATLSGYLYHDHFRNISLDIKGQFTNFQLLNTTTVDNDLYYGSAYGTGDLSITGPTDNLTIKAEAVSTKGTYLAIPLDLTSDTDVAQKDYIQFKSIADTLSQTAANSKTNVRAAKIKGLTLDFNIELTNDAYIELIFDAKSGDIIRGRGNGNMKLLVDTQGEFNMFGDYRIDNGGYNFTMYNIINKEFSINKGSTISWYGDPYRAQLNINARYRQLASLSPLLNLSVDDLASPEARRKYPSYVDLFLTGDLLAPNIKFDIKIEEYPRSINLPSGLYPLDSYISAFKTNIQNNEQEMNRQVFSLIILRKFSPENSFEVNSSAIGNSLSEFISNQLSYWVSQFDENLEVDVDLASLDQDAFNTFQLRLSYTFMDGRLRVTRGGGLTSNQTNDNTNNIIGDWSVEYMLTADGRFRAKVYSRNDLNALQTKPGESNYETGFSLQFVRSFDQLKQILSDKREKLVSTDDDEAL